MDRFIKIPVTSQNARLVNVGDVAGVSAASATATTTVITYKSGLITTVTHAAQVAYDVRDAIQDAIETAFNEPTGAYGVTEITVPKAVSAIATTLLPQATS